MSDFPEPEFVQSGDVRLAVYRRGENIGDRPPVILVHGWPEIAYSWKNQMPAVAAAGFEAVAPDLRGFGRSDAPHAISEYGIRQMAGDLVSVIDHLGAERAVLCGHDWGGLIVWPAAMLHPDRVAGVIGVCTPHLPRPKSPPIESLINRFGENHYIVQFQEDGAPEALFEKDVERFFRIMFRKPVPREYWPRLIPNVFDIMSRFRDGPEPRAEDLIVPEEHLGVYVDAYRKSGFRGGINLYRNFDANHEVLKNVDPVIKAPALWIGAELDMFLPLELSELMTEYVPDLEKRVIENCGHWVMWEKPEALNAHLTDWLTRRFA